MSEGATRQKCLDRACAIVKTDICIIIIIIIERKDLGGVMSKDCKDTLQR